MKREHSDDMRNPRSFRHLAQRIKADYQRCDGERRPLGQEVPNRLFGATVNSEGEAV